jgi:transcriptional regulator
MYAPTHFAENRREVLHALIRERPLATLVTHCGGRLDAEHLPLLLADEGSGHGSLLGHVARRNPLWRNAAPGSAALAIFHGPSAYISPSFYPAKQEHGRVVPTWNYVVVHAHGTLRIHDDADWVRRQIERLTRQMETARERPWAVSDAPPEYVEGLVRGIVGIELLIERLDGKWKVSQNQPAANRAGVAAHLAALGDSDSLAMASLVRAFAPD